MKSNLLLHTDSYKLTHFDQYPPGTEQVFSYFESRVGAEYDSTLFFGLQALLLDKLVGEVVTLDMIDEAETLTAIHLGDPRMFNRAGWEYIVANYAGRLPLQIKAVPEGTVVPVGNAMMTVVNTDEKCYWLTNYMESLLTHAWYSSTVATLSWHVKKDMEYFLERNSDNPDAINFMLHDFGYRGASSDESAAMGGMGHLVNFMGTDTLVAMEAAQESYYANLNSLAFSVPATEHSVMTAQGREGEYRVLDQLLANYPTGILSVVADSYDVYAFTDEVVARKDKIMAREGRFVVRPDSGDPSTTSLELVRRLWVGFGGTVNSKGFKVLDDHVRVLWGDGIDPDGIAKILSTLHYFGFSAENMVFGMGGGLLQKVNRDTQRFAFKSSAQMRGGVWHDICKEPLDLSKKSKAGRLKLIKTDGGYNTVRYEEAPGVEDELKVVFQNGHMVNEYTFDEIRANSRKETR